MGIVDIMKSWIGKNEADGSHKYIIDIYNAQPTLPRGYKVKYTDPWCAACVTAAAMGAGETKSYPAECSCKEMIKILKNNKCWVEDDAYTPTPGDLIFYAWNDTGKGDCVLDPNHVGVVSSVSDKYINVIEGNYKNAVGVRRISKNARYIRGFGLPMIHEAQPCSFTYTVQKGDTLWGISKKYLGSGNKFNEIMKSSGISDCTIRPGQILIIRR